MRFIGKPNYDARDVYQQCQIHVGDPEKKKAYQEIESRICDASDEYDRIGETTRDWTTITRMPDGVGDLNGADMKAVYTRFRKEGWETRPIYEGLRARAPYQRCPLCGHGKVDTLDHYLPKALYHQFVVTPVNLVPACDSCNGTKRSSVASQPSEQTLHPYYDNLETTQWIYAEVNDQDGPVLRFYPDANAFVDPVLASRVDAHFRQFKLSELYADLAASESLPVLRHQLKRIHEAGGHAAVRAHLLEQEADQRTVHVNWWKTAMFQALASSEWYCDGGYSIER